MLTKKYIQKELALRIKGIRPNVTTNTDVLIGELKSALMMVDCLPDDEPEKKYNEAMLRADEAVQKGCLDKDMFDIIFPPEESEDERMIRKIESFLSAYDAYYFKNDEWREIEMWLEKQKGLFESGKGLYYYDGEKTTYCGYTATEDNPYDFAMSQQKEQKPVQRAEEKEFIRTIKSIIADFIRDKKPEDVGFYQQIYDWLDGRHIEPKPVEWSEEDEECRNEMLQYIEQRIGDGTTGQALWKKWYNWLKYFHTQPQGVYKQIVHNILDMIDRYKSLGYDVTSSKTCIPQIRAMCKTADECHEILDEPSWKPSKEQMRALDKIVNGEVLLTTQHKCLESLYEQLKKL